MHAARAPRSWLAALPISSRVRRIEALALQLGPVITVTVLISCFGLLTSAMLAVAGLSAKSCLVAWRSLLLGTFLGRRRRADRPASKTAESLSRVALRPPSNHARPPPCAVAGGYSRSGRFAACLQCCDQKSCRGRCCRCGS